MARFFGAEYLVGTSGSDILNTESRSFSLPTVVHGDQGNDTISGFPDDTLIGGSGDDMLITGTNSGNDVLYGGDGRDRFEYTHDPFNESATVQRVFGGPGADTLVVLLSVGYFTSDEAELTAYAAMLDAGEDPGQGGEYVFENLNLRVSGVERIEVFSSEDLLLEGGGDTEFPDVAPGPRRATPEDLTPAGATDEAPSGPVGSPDLTGDDGRDRIEGDEGDDLILGLGGDDRLRGEEGNDLIRGGAGDDEIIGDEGGDTLYGGSGDDLIEGRRGNDVIRGGSGEDTLNGGLGGDDIVGGKGPDLLIGGFGRDVLVGGAGADRLVGGAGADRLTGSVGSDFLIGGRGKDVFIFADRFGNDRIADFDVERDRMDFSNHSGVSSLADLTLRQDGDAVLVTDGVGGQIKLSLVVLADLDASDFIF